MLNKSNPIQITEEEIAQHFEFVENETSVERNAELQELAYVKFKGKWYKHINEDTI